MWITIDNLAKAAYILYSNYNQFNSDGYFQFSTLLCCIYPVCKTVNINDAWCCMYHAVHICIIRKSEYWKLSI